MTSASQCSFSFSMQQTNNNAIQKLFDDGLVELSYTETVGRRFIWPGGGDTNFYSKAQR